MVLKFVQYPHPASREMEMYSTYNLVVDHLLIDPGYVKYGNGAICGAVILGLRIRFFPRVKGKDLDGNRESPAVTEQHHAKSTNTINIFLFLPYQHTLNVYRPSYPTTILSSIWLMNGMISNSSYPLPHHRGWCLLGTA